MRLIILFLVFLFIGLSGCSKTGLSDQEKTELDVEKELNAKLISQINSNAKWYSDRYDFFAAKETFQIESENAVFVARICDYLVPVCSLSRTAPGRALIAAEGVKYDTPSIFTWQWVKLFAIILTIGSAGLMLVRGWIYWLAPTKQAMKAAKQNATTAKENAKEILETARRDAEKIVLKASINAEIITTEAENNLQSLTEIKLIRKEEEKFIANLASKKAQIEKDVAKLESAAAAVRGRF